MISQILKVIPQGLVESGSVSLTVDTDTGLIDFNESIVGGIGPFTDTDAHSGELKIDPTLLLSKKILTGMKMSTGVATMYVSQIADGKATVNISLASPNIQMSGTAELDLSGEYIAIDHVLLTGTVSGDAVTLELEP